MNNLELSNLIHTMANTDFDKYTIQSEKGKPIVIVPKSKSFFSSSLKINSKKFDEALTKLIDFIHTQPTLLADKTIRSDLCKISERLIYHVNDISSPAEGHKAYGKITQLLSEALFYQWGQSKSNINEAVNSLPLNNAQKSVIREQFIDKNGEMFLQGNALGLSSKFFKETNEAQIRKKIENVLARYPFISSIQIQGYPSITRQGMQKLLEGNAPLKHLATAFRAGLKESGSEIPIHPVLIFNSEFFSRFLSFSSKAGTAKGLSSPLEIPPKAFDLINREDFDSIEINGDNITDILEAANYLQIPSLLKKCDDFLCKLFDNQLIITKDDKFAKQVANLLRTIEGYDLPAIRSLCEAKIHKWITLYDNDPTRAVHCLERIKALKIPLTSLNLSNFYQNTDEDLIKILKACPPNLTTLNLSNNRNVTEAIGPELTRFTQLQQLTLSKTKLTNFGQYLGKLTQLRELNLSNSNVSGIGHHLANLTKLETLNLTNCPQLVKSIIPYMGSLPELQRLNLSSCEVTDTIAPELKKLRKLQELDLSGADVTDKIGPSLKELRQLSTLDLSKCSKITDELLASLIPLKQLTTLNLSKCPKLTDRMESSLGKLRQLKDLNLSECNVSHLIGKGLYRLKNLQTLKLKGCQEMRNLIMLPLSRLPNLQSLDMSSCPRLTNRISPYFKSFPKLKTLNVTFCKKITSDIKKDTEQLKHLHIAV